MLELALIKLVLLFANNESIESGTFFFGTVSLFKLETVIANVVTINNKPFIYFICVKMSNFVTATANAESDLFKAMLNWSIL